MTQPLDLLLARRSVLAANMQPPGPSAEDLRAILTAGARVPDHARLVPWRFVLFEGEARSRFGEVLKRAVARREPDAGAGRLETERARFERAPLVIAVISAVRADVRIPEWEQVLSAGAVCMNLLHGAHALGYAGQWLTEWYAYDDEVAAALGLGDGERVAGFVYIGSAAEAPAERARPDLDEIVSRWPA
jgi:nitroreductase